jgi:peptide/nickel transport system permease protein
MTPVVTAVSGWFASLLAGAVFVEYVFDWKGIGVVIVDALDKFDFPVVMGSVLLIGVMLIIINIVVDIIYGVLDPRVRIK